MRVAHVIDSAGLYGAERVLLELVSESAGVGIDPVLCAMTEPRGPERAIATAARERGIETHRVDIRAGADPRSAWRLRRAVASLRPDVVHSHGYKPNILLGLLPRWARPAPIVATVHGYTRAGGLSRMALYEWLDLRALARLDRVVLVHEGMRSKPGLAALPAGTVDVVENGIEPEPPPAVDASDDAIVRFCSGCASIVAVGRLSPEKGFPILLEAFRRATSGGVEARLAILGDGPDRAALRTTVERAGLGDRVAFAGFVPSAARYLPLFRALALPSLTEGLPVTVLEAMRAGVPVIATRVGGVPRLLQEGRGGTLVPAGDPAALAAAITAVLSDPETAATKARASRDEFLRRYTRRSMAERYAGVYGGLLSRGLPPRAAAVS